MSNLYEVLNVTPDSTIEQIKSAYKKLALRLHPDKNSSPDAKEKFQKVSEAYQILSNPEKRKKYDDYGIIDEEDIDTNMYDMHFEDFMDQFFGSVVDPFMQMFFEGLNPEEDFFQEIENLNPGKKGKNKKNANAKKSKKQNPNQESPFDLFEEIFKNEDYDDS